MTAFANAISAGMRNLRDAAGQDVTYIQGEGVEATQISLKALHQDKRYEAVHQSGVVETVRMDDWIILAEDLVDDSDEPLEPTIGDRIERTLDGFVETFTVADLPGLNCHEPSGDGRFRVHTKQTARRASS